MAAADDGFTITIFLTADDLVGRTGALCFPPLPGV